MDLGLLRWQTSFVSPKRTGKGGSPHRKNGGNGPRRPETAVLRAPSGGLSHVLQTTSCTVLLLRSIGRLATICGVSSDSPRHGRAQGVTGALAHRQGHPVQARGRLRHRADISGGAFDAGNRGRPPTRPLPIQHQQKQRPASLQAFLAIDRIPFSSWN